MYLMLLFMYDSGSLEASVIVIFLLCESLYAPEFSVAMIFQIGFLVNCLIKKIIIRQEK